MLSEQYLFGRNVGAFGEHKCSFDYIAQLADIARPRVSGEFCDSLWAQDGLSLAGEALQEVKC